MRVVYVDVLFVLNLIINYLLLLGTMRFCGIYKKRYRLLLSACAGALYAVMIVLPGTSFLFGAAFKLISGAILIFIAFYKEKPAILLKLYLTFVGLSSALAGMVIAFYWLTRSEGISDIAENGVIYSNISLRVLLSACFISWLLLMLFFRKSGENHVKDKEIKSVEITLFGEKTILYTLVDTGNELRDPITGKRVLIAEYDSVRACFPPRLRESVEFDRNFEATEIFERASKMGFSGTFRLLPYKTVARKENRLMLLMKPDLIKIEERPAGDILLGLSFDALTDAKGYRALVGI